MSFDQMLFYTLLLIVAFALLAVIFDPKGKAVSSTHVVGLLLSPMPDDCEQATLSLQALPGGDVLLEHCCLPLCDGENANLTATLRDDGHVLLVEKKGMRCRAPEHRYRGQVKLRFLKARTYDVRFESEITGQWCTLQFTNVEGQQWAGQLKY